jgi:integrase
LTKRRNIELSEDQAKAFFTAIKNLQKPTRERDYLMFRLIHKYGLKPGEVAGNERQQSRVPGIKISDIVPKRNSIIVHKGPIAYYKVYRLPIAPEDMKQLVQYAGGRTEGKLFHDATADTINYFFHQYAKQANIPRDATPEDLRSFYKPPEIERRYYRYLSEIDSDIVEASLDTADHYVASFCIENTVRRLISRTMEDKYDKNWWNTNQRRSNNTPKRDSKKRGILRETLGLMNH